jgi:hypothetical protein
MNFSQKHSGDKFHTESRTQNVLTVAIGVLGATVTLTSIGAGALGTVTLFFLYPLLATPKLVGTEIAHAVPLTLVAGLGHASMEFRFGIIRTIVNRITTRDIYRKHVKRQSS